MLLSVNQLVARGVLYGALVIGLPCAAALVSVSYWTWRGNWTGAIPCFAGMVLSAIQSHQFRKGFLALTETRSGTRVWALTAAIIARLFVFYSLALLVSAACIWLSPAFRVVIMAVLVALGAESHDGPHFLYGLIFVVVAAFATLGPVAMGLWVVRDHYFRALGVS